MLSLQLLYQPSHEQGWCHPGWPVALGSSCLLVIYGHTCTSESLLLIVEYNVQQHNYIQVASYMLNAHWQYRFIPTCMDLELPIKGCMAMDDSNRVFIYFKLYNNLQSHCIMYLDNKLLE